MALISGEPGIGKSRLVQETTVLARRQGFHVLSVHCYLVEQSLPYQPLIDLARQVMAHSHWQQLAPIWLRELAAFNGPIRPRSNASTTWPATSPRLQLDSFLPCEKNTSPPTLAWLP
jgi:hypothetical protein